jgi:hypothetical protein
MKKINTISKWLSAIIFVLLLPCAGIKAQTVHAGDVIYHCCTDYDIQITYCSSCSIDSLVGTGKLWAPGKVLGNVEFKGTKLLLDMVYYLKQGTLLASYKDTLLLKPESGYNKKIYAVVDSFKFTKDNTQTRIKKFLVPESMLNSNSTDSLIVLSTPFKWINIGDKYLLNGSTNMADTIIKCDLSNVLDSMHIKEQSYIYVRGTNSYLCNLNIDLFNSGSKTKSFTNVNNFNYFTTFTKSVFVNLDSLGDIKADTLVYDYSSDFSPGSKAKELQGIYIAHPALHFNKSSYPFVNDSIQLSKDDIYSETGLLSSKLTGLSDTSEFNGFVAVISQVYITNSKVDSIFGKIKINYISENDYFDFKYRSINDFGLKEPVDGFAFPGRQYPKLLKFGIWIGDALYNGNIKGDSVIFQLPSKLVKTEYVTNFELTGNDLFCYGINGKQEVVKNKTSLSFYQNSASVDVYSKTLNIFKRYWVYLTESKASDILKASINRNTGVYVFPTLVQSEFYLKADDHANTDPFHVKILDFSGSVLRYQVVNAGEPVNISNLSAGMYLIKIELNSKLVSTVKIIKK